MTNVLLNIQVCDNSFSKSINRKCIVIVVKQHHDFGQRLWSRRVWWNLYWLFHYITRLFLNQMVKKCWKLINSWHVIGNS